MKGRRWLEMQTVIRREEMKLLPEKTFSLQRSEQLYEQAKRYLPAGASSNVRVHMHEPFPILFQKGDGPRVCDVDGNCYIDYLMSYGALILGHRHPNIVAGIERQLQNGLMFGTTTELEIEVAKIVSSIVPCAEMVSFANSGTEATMEAVRIARAATGKDKILKFEGHYHGHHDYVLFSVDSPSPVSGLESSPHKLPYFPGIPDEIAKTVIVAPWNNVAALERILKKNQSDVAAVITEPVMGSQGVIPPDTDYLKQLRELTIKYDSLLIFDEVLTGFRLAKGGAQEFYGVKPDLATFAKALGGGAPIAAVAGSRDLLGLVGPGRIGFGGTYNAHPLSLAASKATLETLLQDDGEAFQRMARMGARLKAGLTEAFKAGGYSAVVNAVGPMVSIYFTKLRKISTYRQALQSNEEKFKRFRDEMLKNGVYMHPDGLERLSISAVHTDREIEQTIRAAEESLKALRTQTL